VIELAGLTPGEIADLFNDRNEETSS
jgi:hypothetical protein